MNSIIQTFCEIVAIDSTSKHEELVAAYVMNRLATLGIKAKKDQKGNILGFFPGKGKPLFLNAHMDRVPPGKGNTPIIEKGIAHTDGSTNLGADDAAGITVILELLEQCIAGKKHHPPLVLLFTMEEEIGLLGARALDLGEYSVDRGIVIDNAFEAGVVVSGGAAIYGFDITIEGKAVHSGKEPENGINALIPFWKTLLSVGTSDQGKTRLNIGVVNAGTARNIVPGLLVAQGELRSFLPDEKIEKKLSVIEAAIKKQAEKIHAHVTFNITKMASRYTVDLLNPLIQAYKQTLIEQKKQFIAKDTFIGSDTQIFVCEKKLFAFTLSTGVENEHSVQERVNLIELEELEENLLQTIEKLT